MNETENVTNNLAHTKWNCKYHIVFAPSTDGRYFSRIKEKKSEI